MNKRGFLSDDAANKIAVVYFFLSGVFTLNFLQGSIAEHASGIVFLIAAVYGVVCIGKGAKFIV